jgi:hypothetical protein
MNIKRICFCLCCSITIVGCATALKSSDIEKYYKNFVGQQYNPQLTRGGWRIISEEIDSLEVENYSLGPNCTWSLTVDKKSNTYVAFRFTSDRELCDSIKMFPRP